jgi:DivIVA domain-containing protein
MQDDSFHLTPLDARRYDFGSALRGYDKARVDQFRDQVAEELERLSRVVAELDGKARSFHEQLKSFRDRDKALNEALVSAQQLRGEIREQADREAQLVIREARAEGDRVIDEARAEVRRLQGEVDALDRMRRSYVAQLRALMTRQLMELDAAEQSAPVVARPAARESEGPVAPAAVESPSAPAKRSTPAWLDQSVDE